MSTKENKENAHRMISHTMEHIHDQVEKEQYLNALVAVNDLFKLLLSCLNDVLKGSA